MGHKFAEIAFTDNVRDMQQAQGSRSGYARMESAADYNNRLGFAEIEFIGNRDSFYMASVSETDWPYLQHRGGAVGFVSVLDEKTLGFADYRGNRQYISAGNFKANDKVALFFMDYTAQRRLKLLGKIRQISTEKSTLIEAGFKPIERQLLADITAQNSSAKVERGFVVEVLAFDWNCPKFITPRYTEAQMPPLLSALMEENQELKKALKSAQQQI